MIAHFASVGQDFFYSQYLAIMSAYRVHNIDRVIVWTTEIPLRNPYWKRIEEIAEIRRVDVPYIPGIKRFPLVQQRSIMSDWMRWHALYEYGGLYLDLDTLSIRDITELLGDKDVCVGMENPNDYTWLGSHTIVAKPKSEVIKHAWDFMMSYRRSFRWGMTAPGALADAYKRFGAERMRVLPYEVTSAYSPQGMAEWFNEDAVLPEASRVIHFWGSVHRREVESISPSWVRKSRCPYAVAVKRVLDESEWDIMPDHTYWHVDFQFGVRTGTWDIEIVKHVERYYVSHGLAIREGDVVVDIGAHIGGFALYACELANEVHAYEPAPDNYEYLRFNIELNEVDNVYPYRLAVMDKAGEYELMQTRSANTGGYSITPENMPNPCDDRNGNYERVTVKATTLTEIVNRLGGIDFLKIDAEGAEYAILLSTPASVLERIRTIALETHNPALNGRLMEHLAGAGFDVRYYPDLIPECKELGIMHAVRTGEE